MESINNLLEYSVPLQILTDKKEYKILVISDTHFNIDSDFELLKMIFDLADKLGIDIIIHGGDILNGYSLYRKLPADEKYTYGLHQLSTFLNDYPRESMPIHFITGNHDKEISEILEFDVGHAISMGRKSLIYMGSDNRDIRINNCLMRLRHQVKKSSIFSKNTVLNHSEKKLVDILAFGHTHSTSFAFVNNINYIGIPSLSFTGDYKNDIGAWVLNLYFNGSNSFSHTSSTLYNLDTLGKQKKFKKVKQIR